MGGIGSATTTVRPWGASSCCPSGRRAGTGPRRGAVRGSAGDAGDPFPLLVAGASETSGRLLPAKTSPLWVSESRQISGFWISVTFVGGREPCLCLGRLHVVHDDCHIDVVAALEPTRVAPPQVVGAF